MNYYKMLKEAKKNKLDPVDKDELDGSHDEREDGDIDNDGDEDSSDKYLHGRRKAISKAIAKKKMAKEEAELDEAMTAKQRALAKADEKAQAKKDVSLKKAPWDKKNEEVELDEGSRDIKQPDPHPDMVKAGIKHTHLQSPFKRSKTYVTVDKKDHARAKKVLGNQTVENGGNVYLEIKESVELDEISNRLKDRYIQKSMDDHAHSNAVRKDAESTGNKDLAAKMKARMKKRNQGQSRAFGEEVEELDEVSSKTLTNYMAKASDSKKQATARMADKRIAGQKTADEKLRKKDGYKSSAKVAATEEAEPEFDLVAELAKLITKDAKY